MGRGREVSMVIDEKKKSYELIIVEAGLYVLGEFLYNSTLYFEIFDSKRLIISLFLL